MLEAKPPEIEKPVDKSTNRDILQDENGQKEDEKDDSKRKTPKINALANVKCYECHCVGTVMKKDEEVVLYPNKRKKTLLDLGGGFFMPRIKYVKPTVKIANQRAKKFVEGFNQIEDEVGAQSDNNDGCFRIGFKKFQKFKERIFRGFENARGEQKMKIVEMMEQLDREHTKTPAEQIPERFTSFFSDEFEEDNIWKSKKRFALQ